MHRSCAVGARESRAHEIAVISWALRWCVLGGVLLSRTLAGAVPSALSGLAIRVRDGCRAFPCRCDHRDDCWQCCVVPSVTCCAMRLCGRPSLATADLRLVGGCGVVGGWVGCGPYSGRLAVNCSLPHVPLCSLPAAVRRAGGWGGGGVVCVGRLVPVSSQPLPVFHFWPINPVVCWGPTRTPRCPAETLS